MLLWERLDLVELEGVRADARTASSYSGPARTELCGGWGEGARGGGREGGRRRLVQPQPSCHHSPPAEVVVERQRLKVALCERVAHEPTFCHCACHSRLILQQSALAEVLATVQVVDFPPSSLHAEPVGRAVLPQRQIWTYVWPQRVLPTARYSTPAVPRGLVTCFSTT